MTISIEPLASGSFSIKIPETPYTKMLTEYCNYGRPIHLKEARNMPISPESQYLVDCAHELCLLTADVTSFVYTTFHDVDGMVDAIEAHESRVDDLNDALKDEYMNWRQDVSDAKRALVSYQAVLGSEGQLDEMSSYCASVLIDEYLDHQGYAPMIKSHGLGLKIPSENQIATEDNIAVYLNMDVQSEWHRLFTRQWRHFKEDANRISFQEVAVLDRDRRTKRREFQEGQRRFNAEQLAEEDWHDGFTNKPVDRKKAMKVMKKSAEMFRKHVGEHHLKAFLAGDHFMIEGKEFNYRIKKSANVNLMKQASDPRTHHIPYDLELTDKDNVVLGNMCVYFDNTPALDQIVAMILHIKHDEERMILDKGNVFKRTDAYAKNPVIQEIKRPTETVLTDGRIKLSVEEMVFGMPKKTHDEHMRLKEIYTPVVRQMMFGMLDVPRPALEFMNKPEVQFDEFHMMNFQNIEPRLLPLLEN